METAPPACSTSSSSTSRPTPCASPGIATSTCARPTAGASGDAPPRSCASTAASTPGGSTTRSRTRREGPALTAGGRERTRLTNGRGLRIAIIGAGPGGLCMGIRLKGAGFDDFEILEKAGGVGGTWYHNRYPGCACDIPSHLYSFSFELKRDWSRPYAPQPEILAYLEHCAEKYGLLPHCRFGDAVQRARWDEEAAEWTLETASGRTRRGRRRGQRHRHVQRDQRARHPGPRHVRRDVLPLREMETGSRSLRRDRGRDRKRGQRRPVRSRDREARRQGPPVPAHGELGGAEGGRPLHGGAARALPRRSRVRARGAAEDLRVARRAARVRTGAERHGRRLPRPDRQGRGSGGARAPGARPSLGRQTAAVLQRLLPGLQPTEPRARDRPDRAHHPERRS